MKLSEKELIERAKPFIEKNGFVYATVDGNIFLPNSKNYAVLHAKTNKLGTPVVINAEGVTEMELSSVPKIQPVQSILSKEVSKKAAETTADTEKVIKLSEAKAKAEATVVKLTEAKQELESLQAEGTNKAKKDAKKKLDTLEAEYGKALEEIDALEK